METISLTARGENLVVTARLSNNDTEKNEEESRSARKKCLLNRLKKNEHFKGFSEKGEN